MAVADTQIGCSLRVLGTVQIINRRLQNKDGKSCPQWVGKVFRKIITVRATRRIANPVLSCIDVLQRGSC